jgi:hypothetical protein
VLSIQNEKNNNIRNQSQRSRDHIKEKVGVNVHNKNSICAVLMFDHQLKKILTFSVKDRYQLHYFICFKDFNAETIIRPRSVFFVS